MMSKIELILEPGKGKGKKKLDSWGRRGNVVIIVLNGSSVATDAGLNCRL
jgi:hypothetical protein